MHYFNDKPRFLMLNFAHYTLRQNKTDPIANVKEEYVGTICYKQEVEICHQTLTFLERSKMLRKNSKISMFKILKTSLSL